MWMSSEVLPDSTPLSEHMSATVLGVHRHHLGYWETVCCPPPGRALASRAPASGGSPRLLRVSGSSAPNAFFPGAGTPKTIP